ncbi:aspartate aminotransferase family protein [Patescibacteria group bacterium]|nr:aspartate aminotransferase family protein [Patescibacteria group bacterium]MBU1931227.1 aspartate aminotransferase family protein [Patescibacteria group bacterium]
MIKNKILYSNFASWVLDIVKAKGSYIWDKKGKRLIDFTSAWNVTNLGWNNPEITAVMINQAKKNNCVPGWAADPIQQKYASLLTQSLPEKLSVVIRATGGTEANEDALQLARAYTGRSQIIGFSNAYNGHSMAILALTFSPQSTKRIAPLMGKAIQMSFPRVSDSPGESQKRLKRFGKKLETILAKKDVAGVLVEPGIITGGGSTAIAPKGFCQLIRRLTREYGTLLIFDEVGTGFSRCGKLFGMELEGAVPDIVTLAKGMANGAAGIGAVVTTQEIAEKSYQAIQFYSTFGWMPPACAAALKTLEIHKRDKVWLKAKKDGDYLQAVLKRELLGHPNFETVNGIGMEVGLGLNKDKKIGKVSLVDKVVVRAREKGLFLVGNHENNIQLMPPLTITRKDLDKGIEILVKAIKSF